MDWTADVLSWSHVNNNKQDCLVRVHVPLSSAESRGQGAGPLARHRLSRHLLTCRRVDPVMLRLPTSCCGPPLRSSRVGPARRWEGPGRWRRGGAFAGHPAYPSPTHPTTGSGGDAGGWRRRRRLQVATPVARRFCVPCFFIF